ncbi:M48 family metallopeptidase [Spartinivicinus poritis]|uniref:M48 family metallopeptidase n=1 Tax=Spartinivicinus poritis TaxID=2994640 RepID=A0ABT5UI01_9GAMM|nr:M48 family metallopeptidase [Spartinivicinus sp. A2-2]MDE1465147.1 M48 family metallopeptidase [Spartinivicinus sp. A2-2]
MNKLKSMTASVAIALALVGCKSDLLENEAGMSALGGVLTAATVSESEVINSAKLSAQEMDKKSKVAPANSLYTKRLNRLVSKYQQVDGLKLNYKVYLSKEMNAFAMPDGTVRVYSGLMDILSDQELLSVIGHEIGHVKLKHSFNQYKQTLLAASAREGITAAGGTVADLAQSQLGDIALQFVNARFSQSDELEADVYGVAFMKQRGLNPNAAVSAFQKLKRYSGEGGGLLSSHPATSERINKIKAEIAK